MPRALSFVVFACILTGCSTPKIHPMTTHEFMLDGNVTREALQKNFTWLDERYAKYETKDSVIPLLKPLLSGVKVTIVLGTWCSDSKEHVSAFWKVADVVGLAEKDVEMIAVDRSKKSAAVDVSKYKAEQVPTFIVYRNGKQLGRIVESPKKTVEEDLLMILQ